MTETGIETVRLSAQELVASLDKEKDIIVLWSSPAQRAQGSEFIMEKEFKNAGFSVYKNSEIPLMRAIELEEKDKSKEQGLALARKNAEDFFNWVEFLSKRISLGEKRLRIIGVSHYEFLNPIMEDLFDFRAENGEGFKKGEIITLEFEFDEKSKKLKIDAIMRGIKKSGIEFDKTKRKFMSV